MGPGTIRCLAHSAWPMLWVRQCALSPYPLADCLSSRSVQALDAVTVAAGITTLRPKFWITKKTMRERASAGCESPSGRAI